jgi:PAS domain S-box-containing protein
MDEKSQLGGTTDAPLTQDAAQASAAILLVDDSAARLASYEVILAGMGLDYVRALSGTEALERLLTRDVAAVLLDVSMPGMDGFEVAHLIRAHPRFERTPIIFVTGVHVSQLDRLRGYEIGAIDYISVPVVPEILRAKVAVLVELYQRRRELQQLNRALQEARAQLDEQHFRAAAESEAQLRAVLEHPTELIFVLEPERDGSGAIRDWIYRSANTNALNLLGVARETLIGRRLSEVVPERGPRTAAMCTQVLATREMIRFETNFKGRDFVVTLFAMGSNAVVSSSLDVTERTRAMAQLRESENRFRLMANSAPVMIWTSGVDKRCDWVNQPWLDFTGRTLEHELGDGWTEAVHPDDIEQCRATYAAAFEARDPFAIDFRVRHADGAYRWVADSGVPRFASNGEFAGYIGSRVDIQDRKDLEDQLRRTIEALNRQQQELRTVLDVVPLAVLVARDPAADDIVGSSSFASLTGVPVGENVSQSGPNKDRLPYHYEQQGRLLEAAELPMQQAARTRRVVRDMEMDMVFENGRVVHLLSHATPLFDDQGNVRGAVGANVDITPLTLAHRALETADRQKNDFIATLAHELRNPLAPIRYAATLLKRDTSPESIEHAVRVVERQAGHMARLLDDLLDLSRITRNTVELKRAPLDLRSVLDSAIENALPLLQENGQQLHTDIEARPLWVHGDAVRLLQVVDNLLSNACKFTGPDGRIAVRARREGDQCKVEVSDTGIGITAQQVADVFTMFGQVDPAMQATKSGLGIGLAISRRLMELHGGTIAARSEGPGKGSTFTVSLPCSEQVDVAGDVATSASDSSETNPDLTQLRVLVVDDNIDAAETLKAVLALAGVKAAAAYSAAAAIAAAEATQPNVLLLDVGLPDASGLDVARHIRSTAWGRNALLVALTGWGRPEDRAQAAEAGFDVHLVKPVDGQQVLQVLAEFVRSPHRRG